MSDVKYDAELCERLIAEARHIANQPADVNEHRRLLRALADQLAAARSEVERMQGCMATAGLQCFMRDSTPEQVAEHMCRVARSYVENEAKLTAERDAMRPVVDAAEQWRDDNPPVGVYLQVCIDAYRAARGKEGR